jgi:hypothetical protein
MEVLQGSYHSCTNFLRKPAFGALRAAAHRKALFLDGDLPRVYALGSDSCPVGAHSGSHASFLHVPPPSPVTGHVQRQRDRRRPR